MSMSGITVDDFGYSIQLTIVQDGTAQDISSYTTRRFVFVAPDDIETTKTATFATDGTDGVLTYTVEEGFIDQVGIWSVYAQILKTGSELTSDCALFYAKEKCQ